MALAAWKRAQRELQARSQSPSDSQLEGSLIHTRYTDQALYGRFLGMPIRRFIAGYRHTHAAAFGFWEWGCWVAIHTPYHGGAPRWAANGTHPRSCT